MEKTHALRRQQSRHGRHEVLSPVAGSQAPLQLFLKGSDDAAERDNVRVQMDRKLILSWVLWGFKFVYMICLDVNIQFWMKFPFFQG